MGAAERIRQGNRAVDSSFRSDIAVVIESDHVGPKGFLHRGYSRARRVLEPRLLNRTSHTSLESHGFFRTHAPFDIIMQVPAQALP